MGGKKERKQKDKQMTRDRERWRGRGKLTGKLTGAEKEKLIYNISEYVCVLRATA